MSGHRRNKKDLVIVVLATGCFYFLSIFIDLFEMLRDGFEGNESWNLDELFLTLIFLSFSLLWYSHRRYSDFKVAKSEFHESELRYHTLYKHAPIGIAMAYQDGTLICCNEAMCDMTGYSEDELKRINLDDTYVNPEDRKQHLESFKKGYTVKQGSIPRKRKDGSIYFIDPIVTTFQFEGQSVLLSMVEDITERKAAEEHLDRVVSELKNQKIAIDEHSIVAITDRVGNIIYVNDKFCAISQYSSEELLGQNHRLINSDHHPKSFFEEMWRTISNGEVWQGEIKNKAKNNSFYWVSTTIVPFKDAKGVINQYVSIRTDISRRKFAEEELSNHQIHLNDKVNARTSELAKANKSLLEEIAERKEVVAALRRSEYILSESQKAARIGSYRLDIATGLWESSEILDALFGIGSDYDKSISGWLQIIHPEHREEMQEYHSKRILGNHNVLDRQYRIVRQSDNETRWVHGMGILEFDENGRPFEMIGTVQDITESKESEDALRKSEHRYEELFTSLLEGVCMVDENEKITFCNPAFSKLLEEESPEHLIGKSILDYFSPCQREIIHAQTAIRKTNLCSKYEIELITAKKHRKTMQLSVSPHFDENGEYCGASANVFDTTEVKRLRELESRAQRLETAGRIAGQVAHDFNNLLAPLMAYPELIREELSDDNPAQEYLKVMEKSATQIAEINEQLLTLGRRGHYNLVPMDLNEVLRQVIEDSKQAHSSIEYQISFAEDISKIMGGPAQIHRVILNLLENACDSMKDIGVITISTENNCIAEIGSSTGESIPAGEYVKLTVSDAGEGIEDALLPKIFDPFFSSKETDRRRGSGLGLSVVHSVVQDHGGYIDVSTRVGEGTSFYLYFPVTDKCAKMAGNAEYDGGSESILIVDDDPLQRDVSGKLMARLGYRITLAESGEQAIKLLSTESYDLLILDMIMLPGIDGTETYRRALAVNPEQKAIIVSGFSESVRVTEAKSLGAGAFVKKPLTRQIITRAVRTELDRELDDITA